MKNINMQKKFDKYVLSLPYQFLIRMNFILKSPKIHLLYCNV